MAALRSVLFTESGLARWEGGSVAWRSGGRRRLTQHQYYQIAGLDVFPAMVRGDFLQVTFLVQQRGTGTVQLQYSYSTEAPQRLGLWT